MNLTEKHKGILKGLICPYCGSETRTESEYNVYKRVYKNTTMITCKNFPKCDSYCGTHKDSGLPLGRLANKELRQAKKEAHIYFDVIWINKYMTRNEAYKWLSDTLEIPLDYTHIGMFGIDTCKRVKLESKKLIKTFL